MPFKVRILYTTLIIFFAGILETANMALLYPLINYGLGQKTHGLFLRTIEKVFVYFKVENYFFASGLLLIGFTIIAVNFKVLSSYYSYSLQKNVASKYQKAIIEKYAILDYRFFIDNQQGNLVHTGTIASANTAGMILTAIRLIQTSLNLGLMFSLMVALTWKMTGMFVLIGLFYTITVKKLTDSVMLKAGKAMIEADREKNVVLNEFLTGIKQIKVFSVAGVWKKKFYTAIDKSLHFEFKSLMGRTYPDALMKAVLYILIAAFSIHLSFESEAEFLKIVPVFGTFVVVASRFFPIIQEIGNSYMGMIVNLPNVLIVKHLLDLFEAGVAGEKQRIREFKNEISFKNVYFKFPESESMFLKDINLSIKKNEVTAIVGSSGNGKTTLINLLFRLYDIDQGTILIDGISISNYNIKSFLNLFGYVSQETFIYNDTIYENIRFGYDRCSEKNVLEAAKSANASDFIDELPAGYQTVVGDAGVKLSGGQRQRIAIARAVLRKPEIMVLDEATSSLDNVSEAKVQKAINQISNDATVLVIAHRLSTVINANKIVVLKNGTVEEHGNHAELLNMKGEYYKLFRAQAERQE